MIKFCHYYFYQRSKNYFSFHLKTIFCKLGYFLKMCTIFVGLSKSEWFVLSNEVFLCATWKSSRLDFSRRALLTKWMIYDNTSQLYLFFILFFSSLWTCRFWASTLTLMIMEECWLAGQKIRTWKTQLFKILYYLKYTVSIRGASFF